MDTFNTKRVVFRMIGYEFQDEKFLEEALTAAGAKEEHHDGNRMLAQLGNSLIHMMSVEMGYILRARPGFSTELKSRYLENKRCATIAKAIGLPDLMTFSDRPGARTDSVLNKGINALIGAVYCDSKCVKTTFEVLIYLSWFSLTIYPNEISEPAGSQHPNVQQNMTNEPNPRHPDAEDGLEELENEVDPYDEALRAYLSEEQQRCSFHDYCPPRDTYYNAGIERRLCDLEKKTTVHLRMLFLLIAGPHSFVGLKAKVHHVFTSRDVPTGTYTTILSPPERYEVIRQLDQRIIHFEMIRNYHILLLFKECGGSESSYNLTAEHFHTNTRSSGNPFNARESEITKRMIDRVCPTADSSKFEEFKGLRRMGKRLHTLERMFGTGVLGLMHSHEVAGIKAVGLSHLLKCRTVSDTVFQEFVDLLEETQGELLRIICSAISPVVHSLFKGVITEMMASRIERISEEEILRYQKGSPHLLVHFVN